MRNGVLRWLRKAWKNRITLLAASSSGGSIRGIALPVLLVWVLLAAAVLIGSFMFISYVLMSSSVIHSSRLHEVKDARIRELVAENEELSLIASAQQDRLAFFSDQLRLMDSKVRTISDLGREIIATLGSEVEMSSHLDLLTLDMILEYRPLTYGPDLGAGGVDREALNHLTVDSTSLFRVPDLAAAKIEAMLGELTQDVEAFTLLKSESVSHAHRMDHTPTEWPVSGPVSSPYGTRVHPVYGVPRFHEGIDIAVSVGTPVKATADGMVTWSGDRSGYGLTVIVDHGYGVETLYAHNSRLKVRQGTEVKKGQVIAYSGDTGVSTGPHVHYEVRLAGKSVDPMIYLN